MTELNLVDFRTMIDNAFLCYVCIQPLNSTTCFDYITITSII